MALKKSELHSGDDAVFAGFGNINKSEMATRVTELEAKVNQHLQKMGFNW